MRRAEAGYSSVPKALAFMRQLGRHKVGQSASTMTTVQELAVGSREGEFIYTMCMYNTKCLACMQCTGTHLIPGRPAGHMGT
jgi:hypothetical protein